MHHPYRSAVQGALPQATIIVDKFHVLRLASWAVERVRRDIQSGLPIKSKRKLMRSKRLLARRWDDLDNFQHISLIAWFTEFPLLKFTYWLKEAFYDIYQAPNRAGAMRLYNDWVDRIPSPLQSAFDPLTKAMHNWRKEIFAYFDHRYTNAVTESLNGIIKLANRQGRGYKFRTLRARLLFTNGVRKIHQEVIPNYGWDRDLVDVVLARDVDLGADFSTILKRLHDGSLLPLSTDHSP